MDAGDVLQGIAESMQNAERSNSELTGRLMLDGLNRANARISELESKISELNAQLSEKEAELATLDQGINQKEGELSELQSQIQDCGLDAENKEN